MPKTKQLNFFFTLSNKDPSLLAISNIFEFFFVLNFLSFFIKILIKSILVFEAPVSHK